MRLVPAVAAWGVKSPFAEVFFAQRAAVEAEAAAVKAAAADAKAAAAEAVRADAAARADAACAASAASAAAAAAALAAAAGGGGGATSDDEEGCVGAPLLLAPPLPRKPTSLGASIADALGHLVRTAPESNALIQI
jgi:hypothetical protein